VEHSGRRPTECARRRRITRLGLTVTSSLAVVIVAWAPYESARAWPSAGWIQECKTGAPLFLAPDGASSSWRISGVYRTDLDGAPVYPVKILCSHDRGVVRRWLERVGVVRKTPNQWYAIKGRLTRFTRNAKPWRHCVHDKGA
jgi:hypothetical protein